MSSPLILYIQHDWGEHLPYFTELHLCIALCLPINSWDCSYHSMLFSFISILRLKVRSKIVNLKALLLTTCTCTWWPKADLSLVIYINVTIDHPLWISYSVWVCKISTYGNHEYFLLWRSRDFWPKSRNSKIQPLFSRLNKYLFYFISYIMKGHTLRIGVLNLPIPAILATEGGSFP